MFVNVSRKAATQKMSSQKFLYFAFGSNLLAERIHIKNPSAVFKSVGKVPGYKLDFGRHVTRWRGDVATISQSPDSVVFGVIWELDLQHQETLDRQEEVPHVYKRIHVKVIKKIPSFQAPKFQVFRLNLALILGH